MNKYNIKELSEILDITYSAARRKIKRAGHKTVQETVNGRSVTYVILSDQKLSELVEQTRINKTKHNPYDDQSLTVQDTVIIPEKIGYERALEESSYLTVIDRMNDRIDDYVEKLENLYELRLKSESEVKLLEDKTKSYESLLKQKEEDVELYQNKYFELQYKLEKLQEESQKKEQQINELQVALEKSTTNIWKRPLGEVFKKF